MPPPELVIADASFKLYPGGVIALRCSDWIASGSGTASSEFSAFASTGSVVRETQKVTTLIYVDSFAAYDEAVDTLSIPVSSVPLRPDHFYTVWVTYKIEGDWDETNGPDLRGGQSSNLRLREGAILGMHGTLTETETSPSFTDYLRNNTEHFATAFCSFLSEPQSTDVLKFRAFAQDGSTHEILLDQIVFFPYPNFVNWTPDDFQEVPVEDGRFTTVAVVDGDDGGDTQGKFTWRVINNDIEAFVSGTPIGASDYQRKSSAASAEYMLRVTEDDNYPIFNSVTSQEGMPDVYSLYSVRYRDGVVSQDTFDNRTTTGRNFGIDAQGYGYRMGGTVSANTPDAFVSGGVGIIRIKTFTHNWGVEWGHPTQSVVVTDNQGARLEMTDQLAFSGVLEWTAGQPSDAGARVLCAIGSPDQNMFWMVRLEIKTGIWQFGYTVGGVLSTFTAVGSLHDISGWFGQGAPFGFRIELRRFLLRVRVWDATGAEPSTWDESFFRPLRLSGVVTAYPYSDNEINALQSSTPWTTYNINLNDYGNTGGSYPLDLTLHELQLEHHGGGTPNDMVAYAERPEGTSLGQITIPYGCPYWVYWGTGDWTEFRLGTWFLEFSAKAWNVIGAAEFQRAENVLWWFKARHGPIISMNWRWADRQGVARRVLVGTRRP